MKRTPSQRTEVDATGRVRTVGLEARRRVDDEAPSSGIVCIQCEARRHPREFRYVYKGKTKFAVRCEECRAINRAKPWRRKP